MFAWLEKILNWLKSLFWQQELEVTLIGLQNAGKTTFINVVSTGVFKEDMIPTVGFNMRRVKKGNCNIKVWDIGGQPRFRNMWEKYCRSVKAIIYMVDSYDVEKIQESADCLHDLFEDQDQNPTLEGIPLLVLGNKNDLKNTLTKDQLNQQLRLDEITDREVVVHSISCKNQTNLDTTLEWLIQRAKKN